MDQRDMISSVIFFLLAAFVLITSVGLGIGSLNNPQTGFMPFWTSLLLMVFSLILFGLTYSNRSVGVHWTDLWHDVRWQKSVMAVVVLVVYVLILPALGYLIATSILMMILFKLSSMKIWTATIAAVLAVFFSYGLFSFILKTPLPRGILGF
jgi:putative tricarboxylic transport membrane protein